MNFSFKSAFQLNQIIEKESRYYMTGMKCHLFYTPKVSLSDPCQRKMRISLEQRQYLRKMIFQTLLNEGMKFSQKQKQNLCNTHFIPTLPNGSVSISHCPGLKGFAYNLPSLSHLKKSSAPRSIESASQYPIYQKTSFGGTNNNSKKKPYHIGLDVEVTPRVKTHHVNFLSKRIELNNMPNPSCLWTAKEAAFKCLYPAKLQISQITINRWIATSDKLYNFYFSTPHKLHGRGYCLLWKQWTIAFAIKLSQKTHH